MKQIKIYIYDSSIKKKIQEKLDENDRLGFEKYKFSDVDKGCNQQLVNFQFDENMLSGFWIDPEVDDDTGTKDIIFYLGPTSFKTPFSEKKKEFFEEILINRQK